MEITINTADILGDESTIRDEVIEQVVSALVAHIRITCKEDVNSKLNVAVDDIIKGQVETIIATHIDTEFTETTQFGKESPPETLRSKIASHLEKLCTFKETTYSNDRNPFTSIVKKTVEEETRKFQKEFNEQVTRITVSECLDMATKKLKEACGIKK